jgi:hypothetical protein
LLKTYRVHQWPCGMANNALRTDRKAVTIVPFQIVSVVQKTKALKTMQLRIRSAPNMHFGPLLLVVSTISAPLTLELMRCCNSCSSSSGWLPSLKQSSGLLQPYGDQAMKNAKDPIRTISLSPSRCRRKTVLPRERVLARREKLGKGPRVSGKANAQLRQVPSWNIVIPQS